MIWAFFNHSPIIVAWYSDNKHDIKRASMLQCAVNTTMWGPGVWPGSEAWFPPSLAPCPWPPSRLCPWNTCSLWATTWSAMTLVSACMLCWFQIFSEFLFLPYIWNILIRALWGEGWSAGLHTKGCSGYRYPVCQTCVFRKKVTYIYMCKMNLVQAENCCFWRVIT